MNIDFQNITLRPTLPSDLELLFQFQLDEEAAYLAAFMPNNYTDKEAYISKYTKLLNDAAVNNQTICLDNLIIGSVAKFVMEGDTEITYWLDKQYWGKGITSKALSMFLELETNRPIFGRVAFDNWASQKVLEKCGFVRIGKDSGFATARQTEIEEYIYKLD